MSSFWNNLAKNIRTGLAFSSVKIEEYSHIGKLKLEISGVRRNIDNSYRELGKKTFQMLEVNKDSEIAINQEVVSLIENIKTSEQLLRDLENKLAEASEKPDQKQADQEKSTDSK